MASYLVRLIPQRGFTTRRRSGLVFSVAGTVIEAGQLTPEIEADPGLVVTPIAEGEAARLREKLADDEDLSKDEAARTGPGGDGMNDEGDALCAYPRANGEPCRNRAKEGSRFCGVHGEADGAA